MTTTYTVPRFCPGRVQHKWVALASVLVTTLRCPKSLAAATINVTTTTNGQCSLQEAIYASELKSNTAINSTDPDSTYITGCVAGTGLRFLRPAGTSSTAFVFNPVL